MLQGVFAEVFLEVLFPDLLVAAHGARLLARLAGERQHFLVVRQVMVFPKVGNQHVLLQTPRGVLSLVDLQHEFFAEQLHLLRGDFRVAGGAILLAKLVRPLHSLWLSIYNLSDVVPNMKRLPIAAFVHVAVLRHVISPMLAQSYTFCDGYAMARKVYVGRLLSSCLESVV